MECKVHDIKFSSKFVAMDTQLFMENQIYRLGEKENDDSYPKEGI